MLHGTFQTSARGGRYSILKTDLWQLPDFVRLGSLPLFWGEREVLMVFKNGVGLAVRAG